MTDMEMSKRLMTLETELEIAKTRLGKLSWFLGGLCMLVVCVSTIAWTSQKAGVIRGRRLELAGPDGKVKVALEAFADRGVLRLFDQRGRVRANVGGDALIGLSDATERLRVRITETGIEVADDTGDPRIALIVRKRDEAFLSFHRNGNEVFRVPTEKGK